MNIGGGLVGSCASAVSVISRSMAKWGTSGSEWFM